MPETFKIIITGQVQGVGFRPFIYGLAKKHQLDGEVFNNELGVIIHLNASKVQVQNFIVDLLQKPPVSSILQSHHFESVERKTFSDFKIVKSERLAQLNLPLTPDFAICTDCKTEIQDQRNRRYKYPFTTCVNCGPRYSITTKFPFERENTSMSKFKMCANCQTEYENPENRRFHSQTNSCPECGISLELVDNSGKPIETNQHQVLEKVSEFLSKGKIMAIKNTNGYLLCCDANNADAISHLRQKKHRPGKPFALLYPSLELLRSHFKLTKNEEAALVSSIAPIVILPIQKKIESLKTELIAPNLKQLGVMLPSSALLQLLMDLYQKPIIATSGNLHGSAIHSDALEAQIELSAIADFMVHHDLDIQFPQDDPVVKFSEENQIILRRSRGMAPNYLDYKSQTNEKILATGAHLKTTFAFIPNQQLYISQYFGNLDNYDVLQRFQSTIHKYINLFEKQPETVLVDAHPQYQSSQLGKELAQQWHAKFIKIQHHKAHFASVLGEHELFGSKEKILGVIWDGTGFGDDGMIWGGEFFTYENHQMELLTYFEYVDWIASNKMAEEPRLSLLSLTTEENRIHVKSKFTDAEFKIYNQLLQHNSLKTSSVGRLFDAMASLLDLIDKSTFEGEPAMLLEQCATDYLGTLYHDFLKDETYEKIPSKLIIQKAHQMKMLGNSNEHVAASFIYTLATIIINEAKKMNINIIACSGGVFQNAMLLNKLQALCDNNQIKLKINRKLSSNDENISFGQLMYYLNVHKS